MRATTTRRKAVGEGRGVRLGRKRNSWPPFSLLLPPSHNPPSAPV